MRKTTRLAAVFAALLALSVTGCKNEPDSVPVESVTLSETTLTLEPGETAKLTATVKPDNADDKTVLWYAADTSVATVSDDGTVTAVNSGGTIITARTRAGDKTATCEVTVSQIRVEAITLDREMLTLKTGTTGKLTATITLENASKKTITWSSSDRKVAGVDNDGTIYAYTEGTATITAQADGKTATCVLTVKDILVAVESVLLEPASLTLTRGETRKLTATVTPNDADNNTVTWSSSDTAIATVDKDGTVTAHGVGTTTITAQADDITAECAVTVNPILVDEVTLDKDTLTLISDETVKLAVTVTPSNADDTTVIWSSSNTEVATVSDDGTVTVHTLGTTTITAQAGGKEATCEVIVHDHFYTDGKCTVCEFPKPDMGKYGTIDENGILTKYSGNEANVVIPEGVSGISYNAFSSNRYITSVKIPGSVKSIKGSFWGDIGAFSECTNLKSVEISEGVKSIGAGTFYGCTNLESVTIPASVTSIEDKAFSKCTSLETVTYKGTLEQWCALDSYGGMSYAKHVTMSDGTDLKTMPTLEIPASVTKIGDDAFAGCTSLTNMTIPNNVMSANLFAFSGCTNLTSVTIGNRMTSIASYMFSGCTSLTDVTIPNSVKEIEWYAFYKCTSLENITIPANVTKILDNAFKECHKLDTVKYDGTKEDWGDIERGSSIFLSTKVTEITDKDGVTFTVDKDGNITAE